MITKEALTDLFEQIQQAGQAEEIDFSTDEPCCYSFFFLDKDQEKLTTLGQRLETLGYQVVGFIDASDPDNPEDPETQDLWYLRADRNEQHTVESLHARNQELYSLAEEFDIQDYDGVDIGPIEEQTITEE